VPLAEIAETMDPNDQIGSDEEFQSSSGYKPVDRTLLSSVNQNNQSISRNDVFLEEFLTEEDVAIFQSQQNDIPAFVMPTSIRPRLCKAPRD